MGVARAYIVGSPYNGSELVDVDFEQTADTMFLAHIDHPPQELLRAGHVDWLFKPIEFGPSLAAPAGVAAAATNPNVDADNDGAAYFPQTDSYVVTAVNDDTGQESRASAEDSALNDLGLKKNYNTVTWSAVAGATRYKVYKAHNSQFFGYIGTTEELTFRDDNIGPALDQAPPQGFDPFDGPGNYPSTVTLFEQRLLLARTKNAPNAVWGSRSGGSQFRNFDRSRPLLPDDSLSFSIVAGRVNSVEQLASTTSLLALTSDAIFNVDGDGNGGVLTATSQAPRRQIGRGSSRLPPLVVDNVVFYAPSVGRSIRTINFSFEIDGLKSDDVSIFCADFFPKDMTIVSWCYSQEPRSVIWAVRSDGKLLCFTWEQEQNVWGWTICETDGEVQSVCSITENGEDRVYLIVKRVIGGADRYFIERMASHDWTDLKECCFLDCAVTGVFEEARSTFSGLWHLDGRTDVAALVDGVPVTGLTVIDGTVTLPPDVPRGKHVTFGLPYEVHIETLPVRANVPGSGWNVARKQQAGEIALTLNRSSGVYAGSDVSDTVYVKQRLDETYGSPDNLMTGDYSINSGNVQQGKVCVHVRQAAPLPLTVLGVFVDPIINE
ncbi:hypothetical protein [Sphingopyxis macrogoltabida]|uniref:Uncharacterized protein n=1 Tax=Sphingopyxis macrogoltabida TaxID=33050 RepID=A0A0N9UHG8_SPHMC|nr:hypothetical protein [Sphingopyxis macrogoltabida]ALH82905.1 hypothetical protein AN936_21870 [Sphingopyxis macrogoltabida]